MLLIERNFSITDVNYRFGFNSQEQDDEFYGNGNINTADFWSYDARLGRRWNIDPIEKAFESSYTTFSCNPILFIDLEGKNEDWYKDPDSDGSSYNDYKWFENMEGTEGDPYVFDGKTWEYVGKTSEDVGNYIGAITYNKMMSQTITSEMATQPPSNLTAKPDFGETKIGIAQVDVSSLEVLGVNGYMRVLYVENNSPFWEGGRNVLNFNAGIAAGFGAGISMQGGTMKLFAPSDISLTTYLNEQTESILTISADVPIFSILGVAGTLETGVLTGTDVHAYRILMGGVSMGAKFSTSQRELTDYIATIDLPLSIGTGYFIRPNEKMSYQDSVNRATYMVRTNKNPNVVSAYESWLRNNLVK